MDAAMVSRLCGPEGARIFAALPSEYSVEAASTANSGLRAAGYPVDLVAAALTQWELRHRASAKFGSAGGNLFFTRDGLEQSTRSLVADLHAERFARLGVRHVWDLGCGIGGDAMAFRRQGIDVTAVDSDPLTAAVAAANLDQTRAESTTGARVWTGELEDVLADVARESVGDGAVWLDPARRTPGVGDAAGRTRRIRSREDMSPSWDVVLRAARAAPSAGVKVGAGFNKASLPPDATAQWISVDGSALECVLWWGNAARSPQSLSASVHRNGHWHHLVAQPIERPDVGIADRHATAGGVVAGSFVYEVDPAVLAAGMRDRVCDDIGGRPLGLAAYAWSPRQVATPWARCWQITEVLPLSAKTLRAWARHHDIGPLTLKKPSSRSKSPLARLDPEVWRAKIGPSGSAAATLLLTEIDEGGTTAALWVGATTADH